MVLGFNYNEPNSKHYSGFLLLFVQTKHISLYKKQRRKPNYSRRFTLKCLHFLLSSNHIALYLFYTNYKVKKSKLISIYYNQRTRGFGTVQWHNMFLFTILSLLYTNRIRDRPPTGNLLIF